MAETNPEIEMINTDILVIGGFLFLFAPEFSLR